VAPLAEVGSTGAALGAVASGSCAAVLSRRAIESGGPHLRALRIAGLDLRRDFSLLRRRDAVLAGAAEDLVAYLRDTLPE
jgi:DNA-binding transcriptional LysR family regulator